MDGMTAMLKEQAPFLSAGMAGGEAVLHDEFMVVPNVVEDSFPTAQLDEFLLEANFAGLTGTILSPRSVDHVHQFCTIDGEGGGRQHAESLSNQDFLFDHPPRQDAFLQQHQPLFDDESNFVCPPVAPVEAAVISQYFDDDFDFDGGQQQSLVQACEQVVQVESAMVEEQEVWPGEVYDAAPVQFSELDDPGSNWLAEHADLKFIEQMASENDQHCQLLDELLRDDNLFQEVDPSSEEDEASRSEQSEASMAASDILNEIYREAQQLDFAVVAPSPVATVRASSTLLRSGGAQSMGRRPSVAPSQVVKPQFHLADHDFGAARRGRPPGSSKKRGSLKRDLKHKKQHQNREAALRYRLKKRAEKLEKEGELEQLQKRNQLLKNEKYSLTAEVKYLKELLFEIRKLKGYQ